MGPCVIILYACVVHALVCAWAGAHVMRECVWPVSKWESGSIWRFSPWTPLPLCVSLLFSLLFRLCCSFSWFDLRQNSIPQFHTLSGVDKGPARCSRAPERDTACMQNGRKSNSSRQWGPFVELSRMKGPYLASHCFSYHVPVSHCQPEKNKSLFKRKKVVKNCFGPIN